MKKGFCIALTGGIACGKSVAADLFRRWGAEVADADEVAHELLAPGGECVAAVAAAFGPQVRTADGGIDRQKLAGPVFADPRARARLEALVHPAVIRRLEAWAAEIRAGGRLGVAVIPLLFEVGLERNWDAVVSVVAGESTVLARLAQRGLSEAEARARIASQWPVAEKAARSDYVIENNGSLAELEEKCQALWKNLVEKGE